MLAEAAAVAIPDKDNYSPAPDIVVNQKNYVDLDGHLRIQSDREKSEYKSALCMTSYRCCSYGSGSVGGKGVASGRSSLTAWEMWARLVGAAMMTVVVGHVYLRNTYTKTRLQGTQNRNALTHQAL